MVMINIRLIFVATFVTEYLETDAEYSMLEWTYAKKYAFVGTNFTNEISARKAITAIFCASFCSKIMSCTGFLFSKDFRTCRFLSKFLTAANNSQLTKQKWIYFERNKEEVDCPDVWKENQRSMYCFVHQKVNWTSAQQKCSTMGAYLVAIESEQEDAWINQQILLYREKGIVKSLS
ncbi:C-type lectin domain family 4 member E-like, partial [Saccostrea cucullata]|uniref:C-type lectin domain family 4 member E-like n=1 Tax=Saccostrea cuccullata TaxID=36930 RepID=UPI002ED63904